MVGLPVLAAEPHENPDAAKVLYNGTYLFNFYSNTLDFILTKNPSGVDTNLEKAPYANIPPVLSDYLDGFETASKTVCTLTLNLDKSIPEIKTLLQQTRYNEAAPLIKNAYTNISLAEENVTTLEQATMVAGINFKVPQGVASSPISVAYGAVLDRIQRLRDLVELYRNMLSEQLGALTPDQINALTPDQLAKLLAETLNKKPLLQTQITLTITPTEAFVGDTIKVEGILSSEGNPLGNRQINILLNGLQSLTVNTDVQGHYDSDLQMPYWYIQVIQIQALYFPNSDDVGVYSSSLSPPVTLNVLYYTAVLTLKTDANSYPGRQTSIIGQFDYGQSPALDPRKIEVYLDNTLIITSGVSPGFTEKLSLPADMEIGKHLITISAIASGRYNFVTTDAILNVIKAIPVLTLHLPSVAFIPGTMQVKGQLNSELGPVGQAHITMTFAKGKADIITADDGMFLANIKNSMGFGLFGSQTLEFSAIAQEPWQDNLTISRKVMTVYLVNCSVFLLALALLGIILPRRIRFRRTKRVKQEQPQEVMMSNEMVSESNVSIINSILPDQEAPNINEPNKKLFDWYRIIIQLVQKVSGVLLKPNQTLREFVGESSKALGLASKYFLDFTKLMERVLYSPYKVTEDDEKKSEQLARHVRESLKK